MSNMSRHFGRSSLKLVRPAGTVAALLLAAVLLIRKCTGRDVQFSKATPQPEDSRPTDKRALILTSQFTGTTPPKESYDSLPPEAEALLAPILDSAVERMQEWDTRCLEVIQATEHATVFLIPATGEGDQRMKSLSQQLIAAAGEKAGAQYLGQHAYELRYRYADLGKYHRLYRLRSTISDGKPVFELEMEMLVPNSIHDPRNAAIFDGDRSESIASRHRTFQEIPDHLRYLLQTQ